MVMITFSGCDAKEKQEQKTLSLSEYLEESNENWFLTGKKEYTIQAMMVSKEMTFHNDLEVVDLVAREMCCTRIFRMHRTAKEII